MHDDPEGKWHGLEPAQLVEWMLRGWLAGSAGIAVAQDRVGSGDAGRLKSAKGKTFGGQNGRGGVTERRDGFVRHRGGGDSSPGIAAAWRCCMQVTASARSAGSASIFRDRGILWIAEPLVARLDYFRAIGGSALTDSAIAVPENEWEAPGLETSAIPVTYVPFRNAHFLRVAVSWAEATGAERNLHRRGSGRQFRLPGLPAGVLRSVSGIDSPRDTPGNKN